VISAVFDTAFSTNVGAFDLTPFIGLILARLPVKGDLNEASYIYEVILSLASTQMSLLLPHVERLFTVLVETLALPNNWFEDVDFRDGTLVNMVTLLRGLTERLINWEKAVENALQNDPVRLSRFQTRFSVHS
jgi:hypothetical protein